MSYERYWVFDFKRSPVQRSLGTEEHPERLDRLTEEYPAASWDLIRSKLWGDRRIIGDEYGTD